ncbi:MAG TPA: MOSC domain-containing protein [Terriglobia bacterium]|nr:MOSC domain-containing protein [Terriglobia bacterium]
MIKVLSVNAGLPKQIASGDQKVTTGILKTPVSGRVKVNKLNLEGDAQADLSVHGGPNKAVYAYPSEHYAFWKSEFPDRALPWGMFGENLTLEGLLENDAHIGDQFRIGTAVLMVTQPRTPCYKLGMKFGRADMEARFLASGRTGFYLAVVEEGEIRAGDPAEQVEHGRNQISISTLLRLYYGPEPLDAALVRQVLEIDELPSGWRKRFLKRL